MWNIWRRCGAGRRGAAWSTAGSLFGGKVLEKKIVVHFNNTINLAHGDQKEAAIAAIEKAIAELKRQLDAVVVASTTVDPRLAFDGASW